MKKKEFLVIQRVDIDGVMYYKDRYCGCNCGNLIECKDSHQINKIPEYIHGHNWKNKKRPSFSEEHKRKIGEAQIGMKKSEETKIKMCGKIPWNKGLETGPLSIEHKFKLSKSLKGNNNNKLKDVNNLSIGRLHVRAANLHLKDHCEICGISNEDYKLISNRNLSMHCRDDDNYTDLSPENWLTVCEFGCHQKMDKLDRR